MHGRSPRGPFPALAAALALLAAAAPAVADDPAPAPAVPTTPDISAPAHGPAAPPPAHPADAGAATVPAPPPPEEAGVPELTGITFESVALTTTGFLTAFVVHEACHAAANLAFGNVPTLEPVRFLGVVPFFAISPGIQCNGGSCTKRDGSTFRAGPRGYGIIVSAGIVCQEATDEIILTSAPRIRYERSPFLKGMLLFNTAASVAYGIANLAGIEPPEGDLRGYDSVARVPHGVLAATVLATAALDVARYLFPDEAWLPWVSRGTKVVTVGLLVAF